MIKLSHVKQRVDRYSDRYKRAYAVASLRYLMSSPRSFSFLIPAKTIFVPAWTVSESRRLELQRRSRALDELLRHLQPRVHGLVVPGHVRILEGSGVVVALHLSGLVPEDAVEVRALLAVAAGVHRVAGAALRFEYLCTLG